MFDSAVYPGRAAAVARAAPAMSLPEVWRNSRREVRAWDEAIVFMASKAWSEENVSQFGFGATLRQRGATIQAIQFSSRQSRNQNRTRRRDSCVIRARFRIARERKRRKNSRMNPPRFILLFFAMFWLRSAAPTAIAAATTESPFAIRGTLPWHNFLSGPTTWDEPQFEEYLDRLRALGLNCVVFHCYTGGAERYTPYVEPLIRIRYRDVIPLAALDTSLTARWGYRPLRLSEFAFDTARLFPHSEGEDAFGAHCAVLATTNEERYARAQALMRRVVSLAHDRGIQVGLGFEFGIHPPELASIVPPDSMIRGAMLPDPTHPSSIEILHHTIDNILEVYPDIDWIWLWLHEHTMHVGTPQLSPSFQRLLDRERDHFAEAKNETALFTGVWSVAYIREACVYLRTRAPRVRIAISGWGGGDQLPAVLQGLDRALPPDIVFTCLNPGQGTQPQPEFLAAIGRHRAVWAIPWLEGDASLWHLQPRVKILRDQVGLAADQGLNGVLAIHWRTEETRLNLEAFARFAANPGAAPGVEAIYAEDCARRYGVKAAVRLAPELVRWDIDQWLVPASPEYYAYDPSWGRLQPGQRERVESLLRSVNAEEEGADDPWHKSNLDWLAANLEFTLLLDEVGRRLEPAYRLKNHWLSGEWRDSVAGPEWADAKHQLESAPIERLFLSYARRVRSRGELGVLSSLNQRVWLQYRELEEFLQKGFPDGRAHASPVKQAR